MPYSRINNAIHCEAIKGNEEKRIDNGDYKLYIENQNGTPKGEKNIWMCIHTDDCESMKFFLKFKEYYHEIQF